jgi:hypothetical protein
MKPKSVNFASYSKKMLLILKWPCERLCCFNYWIPFAILIAIYIFYLTDSFYLIIFSKEKSFKSSTIILIILFLYPK